MLKTELTSFFQANTIPCLISSPLIQGNIQLVLVRITEATFPTHNHSTGNSCIKMASFSAKLDLLLRSDSHTYTKKWMLRKNIVLSIKTALFACRAQGVPRVWDVKQANSPNSKSLQIENSIFCDQAGSLICTIVS